MKISVAIPSFNRMEMTLACFYNIIHDDRVGEVVIVDDASDFEIYESLAAAVGGMDKVRLFRNDRNKDCYANKRAAVELSFNPWVLLADSDNVFGLDYLEALTACQPFESGTIYAPVFAAPHFDYREFSGITISKENVSSYMSRPIFTTALNTCNFVINRDEYLKVWRGDLDPITADSIYFNYCWLAAGNKIKFVPNLEYQHTVHPLSHYKLNAHRSGSMHIYVENLLKELR